MNRLYIEIVSSNSKEEREVTNVCGIAKIANAPYVLVDTFPHMSNDMALVAWDLPVDLGFEEQVLARIFIRLDDGQMLFKDVWLMPNCWEVIRI